MIKASRRAAQTSRRTADPRKGRVLGRGADNHRRRLRLAGRTCEGAGRDFDTATSAARNGGLTHLGLQLSPSSGPAWWRWRSKRRRPWGLSIAANRGRPSARWVTSFVTRPCAEESDGTDGSRGGGGLAGMAGAVRPRLAWRKWRASAPLTRTTPRSVRIVDMCSETEAASERACGEIMACQGRHALARARALP